MSVQSQIANDWKAAQREAMRRGPQRGPRLQTGEIHWDADPYFKGEAVQVPAGNEVKFVAGLGMERCKKSEATALLIVGKQDEGGAWIIGQHRNIWMRPKKVEK